MPLCAVVFRYVPLNSQLVTKLVTLFHQFSRFIFDSFSPIFAKSFDQDHLLHFPVFTRHQLIVVYSTRQIFTVKSVRMIT